MPQQRRPLIPGHAVRVIDDVVAGQCADGNAHDAVKPQVATDSEELLLQAIENLFAIFNQIHFVDGGHDVGYAQQRSDVRMPASLRL